jgi:hypothetical protein
MLTQVMDGSGSGWWQMYNSDLYNSDLIAYRWCLR